MLTIVISEKVANTEKMIDLLERIVELVKQGYTSGISPDWDVSGEECLHQGVECAFCGEEITVEEDGTSSPQGSMHEACAEEHMREHPEEW